MMSSMSFFRQEALREFQVDASFRSQYMTRLFLPGNLGLLIQTVPKTGLLAHPQRPHEKNTLNPKCQ